MTFFPSPDGDILAFHDGSTLRVTDQDRPPQDEECSVCGLRGSKHAPLLHDRDDSYTTACGCDPDGPEYHCNDCGLPHPNHTVECKWGAVAAESTAIMFERNWFDTEAKDHVQPMRIRHMTLPVELNTDGPLTKPFVIIIDRVYEEIEPEDCQKIINQTGARGLLFFPDEIQIGDD